METASLRLIYLSFSFIQILDLLLILVQNKDVRLMLFFSPSTLLPHYFPYGNLIKPLYDQEVRFLQQKSTVGVFTYFLLMLYPDNRNHVYMTFGY